LTLHNNNIMDNNFSPDIREVISGLSHTSSKMSQVFKEENRTGKNLRKESTSNHEDDNKIITA